VEGHRDQGLPWQCEQAVLYDWATYNLRRSPVPNGPSPGTSPHTDRMNGGMAQPPPPGMRIRVTVHHLYMMDRIQSCMVFALCALCSESVALSFPPHPTHPFFISPARPRPRRIRHSPWSPGCWSCTKAFPRCVPPAPRGKGLRLRRRRRRHLHWRFRQHKDVQLCGDVRNPFLQSNASPLRCKALTP